MRVHFTPAEWAVIQVAAIIDGYPVAEVWVKQMVKHLAGLLGPDDIPEDATTHMEDECDLSPE